ncbi:MAG: hypothetical protein PVH59_13700, partial [Anaerolineae bacterium]
GWRWRCRAVGGCLANGCGAAGLPGTLACQQRPDGPAGSTFACRERQPPSGRIVVDSLAVTA